MEYDVIEYDEDVGRIAGQLIGCERDVSVRPVLCARGETFLSGAVEIVSGGVPVFSCNAAGCFITSMLAADFAFCGR
jgi:hypothetical protein